MTLANAPESPPYGHQDPAWRPDGRLIAYVRNGRDGTRGVPAIGLYDPTDDRSRILSGPGYLQPAWSPDGRWLAVTRTTSLGTDIAILDARDGTEILRVTDDGRSWAPVWSPAGDAIAFLHVSNQVVDLKMARLEGSGPNWTVGETVELTRVSGLDSGSRPSWYIPPDQLPETPPPSPSPEPSGAAAPEAGGAASPGQSGAASPGASPSP